MDRRHFLLGCASATVALAGCGGTDGQDGEGESGGSEFQGPTDEDRELVDLRYRDYTDDEIATIKDEAEVLAYDDLARNAEDRVGDYIKFNAYVIQYLENDSYTAYLLSNNARGNELLYGSFLGDRFLEGDLVSVWAEVLGTETYVQAAGGQQTVPAIAIAAMELAQAETETSA